MSLGQPVAATFCDLPSYSPLASLLHLTPLEPIYFLFFSIIFYMIKCYSCEKIVYQKI